MLIKAAGVISRILWACTVSGALLGLCTFISTYVSEVLLRSSPDISAPQMTDVSMAALAMAVLPYVLAHAWDAVTRPRG